MTDKSLVIELPAELLNRAQAAQLDLRQVLIDALEQKLPLPPDDGIRPTLAEVEAAYQASLERIAKADPSSLRILGLREGTGSMSDDFDDPLPDEFWLSGNP